MKEYVDEAIRWVDEHLVFVVAGLSSLLIFALVTICLCMCIKCKRRQLDESCEPLHYPSSTLQYIRFNQVIKGPSSTIPVVKI